jgi:hypothetical protein
MKSTLIATTFSCLLALSASAQIVERWNSLPAKPTVIALQRDGIAKRNPDTTTSLTSAAITALPAGTGLRVRAMLTVPTTGNYTLSISAANAATLWLSPSESRFGKQPVATHFEATAAQEWSKFPSQQSAIITLTAGQRYYLEAQVMSSAANGHLALGWKTPGSSTTTLIPIAQLGNLPADADDLNDNNLPDAWEDSTGLSASGIPNALREFADPDNDAITNRDEYLLNTQPLAKETLTNGLTRETWNGAGGGLITDLYGSQRARFLSHPSEIAHVPTIDDQNRGSNVITRYRGALIAPITGYYRLWIAGNDKCELWFAAGTVTHPTSQEPLRNALGKQRLAHNQSPVDHFPSAYLGFDRLLSQRSRAVYLTAGQSYYLEVLHKKGGGSPSHIAVAWQVPGQPRTLIPATALLGYTPDDGDLDDDSLPDAWESANTLSTSDNGLTNNKQGQQGDFDSDGLTNLIEFQNGTNPKSADTDGDGISDFNEIHLYGSNPTVSNNLAPNLAAAPNLHQYTNYTGGWTANANGSLSAWDSRGEITHSFTLDQPGVHEITIKGAAIGTVRATEVLPIVLSLDSKGVIARSNLTSLNGGQGSVRTVTPWLAAGTHTLTILHDNYLSARRLRIDSINIHRLGGQDLDANGRPDWIEQNAARQNGLTRVPANSRTSPTSIEGITENLPVADASYTPHGASSAIDLPLVASINSSFFTNVPLSPGGTTSINATFLNGLVTSSASVTWIPTNLLDTFADNTIHIRLGDSLRLTAHDPALTTENATGTFAITGNAEFSPLSSSSSAPVIHTFTTPGSHTLSATWTPESGPTQTATVTVVVHTAHFGPTLSVRAYSPRTLIPTALDAFSVVEPDENITLAETTVSPGTTPRTFSAGVQQAGIRHIIARLPDHIQGAPSAILARGTVHGFYIAYLNDTADARIIQQYPDGTWLMAGTLIAVNLPADISIKLRTEHQGTTFADGTRTRWLNAADFNANGIAEIYFEWSGTGAPKICNHLQVFVEQ